MIRALLLVAVLLVAGGWTAPNKYETATACKIKGDDMGRRSDRADAWQWFCMEQNHYVFSQALCQYSTPAIYKPECWTLRSAWPTAEQQ